MFPSVAGESVRNHLGAAADEGLHGAQQEEDHRHAHQTAVRPRGDGVCHRGVCQRLQQPGGLT